MTPSLPPTKLARLLNSRPQPVALTDELVSTSLLPGLSAPLVCQPNQPDLSLSNWLAQERAWVETKLHQYGGLLFRGFRIGGIEAFRQLTEQFWADTMTYQQRSSPRSTLSGNVYTSTDHPADQYIPMHNELSYAPVWPGNIMFYCATPSPVGGETPLADSRRVFQSLQPATQQRFLDKGIGYRRNLSPEIGLPWQEVFQTSDRTEVEAACRQNRMSFVWKANDRLQLTWVKPAVMPHPVTGEHVWFNHGLFFNRFALDPLVSKTLSDDELPFNTCYGDGSPIEPAVLQEVTDAFAANLLVFRWQANDLLLLDNLLMAHGRHPYEGPRQIAVAMFDPQSLTA